MQRHEASAVRPVVNAMSIDVEDYFHVSVFDGIVPRSTWDTMESRVVREHRPAARRSSTSTAFAARSSCSAGWPNGIPIWCGASPRAGHEVASHGYAHRLIYDQTPAAFRDDVRRAKHVLEDAAGRRVVGYRAPSYSITPRSLWALDVLIEEGYEYDSSIFPIRHDRYGIPSRRGSRTRSSAHGRIARRSAGVDDARRPAESAGRRRRLLPAPAVLRGRGGASRASTGSKRRPAIFYLHPWEIDPDQPRLPAGRLGRFRHYRNLDETEARLRQLLTDFSFDTVEINRGLEPPLPPDGGRPPLPLP